MIAMLSRSLLLFAARMMILFACMVCKIVRFVSISLRHRRGMDELAVSSHFT